MSPPVNPPVNPPVSPPVNPPVSAPYLGPAPSGPPEVPPSTTPISVVPSYVPVNIPPAINPSLPPTSIPGCNGTGDTSPHCKRWGVHSGWHGPDCGCEVRPVLDCVEHVSGDDYRAHWGYKVWCRRGARPPPVIRQPYGWGNRFLPGQGNRGQPQDFCTDRNQYRDVFTTDFEYNGNHHHHKFKFEAWVLGHRIAILVPAVHINTKQCSSTGGSGSGGYSGGNGHEHRAWETMETAETDSESTWVTKDFPEYSYRDARAAHIDAHKLAIDASSEYSALVVMTATNPVTVHGRASCTNFVITGETTVHACYNITTALDPTAVIASGCTSVNANAEWRTFSQEVQISPKYIGVAIYVTVRPEVPGGQRANIYYKCAARSSKNRVDDIAAASSLSTSFALFALLFAALVALM